MSLPIRRVVVHPDGALVHRAGVIPAQGGAAVVGGLPWLLDPTSVRVEGAGVGEVEVDLDAGSLTTVDRPAAYRALAEATLAVARLGAEIDGLRAERAWIGRLSPSFVDEPERRRPTAATLSGWVRADRAVEDALAALDARAVALGRSHRDAVEARDALASRVAAESGEAAWRHVRPTRRLRVSVPTDGPVHLAVSYAIPGAAWSPAYVLDAEVGLTRGQFSLRALVVQATGEDWADVDLALSTSPVARRVDLPTLRSLRLSTRQERIPAAYRDLPADLDTLFPAPPPPPPPPPAFAPTTLVPEAVADTFDLDDELTPRMQAAPMPLAPKRGGGPLSGLGQAVGGAIGAVFGADAPSAAPVAAAPPQSRVRNARPTDDGRTGRAEPEPPASLQVDALDYGRMRLQGPDAGPGRRGRLFPAADLDRVTELSGATDRVASQVDALQAASGGVERVAWPPHHVLAAPVAGNDRVFDVVGRVDLPADGALHNVAVTSWPAALTVSYRAVPRSDPRAFRLVDVRLEGGSGSLLPGPVDVLVAGRLELSTPWAGSAGRGQLRIGLGAEDRLKVVRNVRYREESAGLFGGSRRVVTQVEVTVASALPTTVRVELLDRVPLPADKETLTVEITEGSPVAEVWKGEPEQPAPKGVRLQRLEVAAGGEARASLSYAVTLGAKDELVGGDHRG